MSNTHSHADKKTPKRQCGQGKRDRSIIGIATLETVERGGKTFFVNPYTHELRPLDPVKGGFCKFSPDLESLLRSRRQTTRESV